MTPKEIYEKESGNKAPDNQIAYHEWYVKYVEWLENYVMTKKVNSVEKDFKKELESLINKYCVENGSDTPDFILAEYINDCIDAFDKALSARSKWYGKNK